MKKAILFVIITTVCSTAFALDFQALLKEDLVTVKGDKMLMEEYYLVNSADEQGNSMSFQVKAYAEAPSDGCISRDNFVSNAAGIVTLMMAGMGEIKYLETPIGNVDFELNMYMTASGYQLEIKDNNVNTTERIT